MKDENGELIPEGTPIIDDEAVHELATEQLDISQTNVDATVEYARLMDMTWSDDVDGWVDWNEYSLPKYYCSKCKQRIKDSFSSECCGSYAINRNGYMIVNQIV